MYEREREKKTFQYNLSQCLNVQCLLNLPGNVDDKKEARNPSGVELKIGKNNISLLLRILSPENLCILYYSKELELHYFFEEIGDTNIDLVLKILHHVRDL